MAEKIKDSMPKWNDMKERYRIYNYLKNHEGALIALVSGVAGFVIMALNFVLYITDRFYLSEWNCSLIPVENSPSRFYSLCIWFVFFFCVYFMGKLLGKATIEFQNDVVELNNLLRRLKKIKKIINSNEKLLKNERKRAKKEETHSDFQEISNKINAVKPEYLLLRKEVLDKKTRLQLKTILRFVILSAECSIPMVIIKYIQTLDFLMSLKSTFLTTGLFLLTLIPVCLLVLNVFRKKITGSKNMSLLSNTFLSDSMIIRNCKSAALLFVFIVVQILFNAFLENLTKKNFEIFSIENREYASIYESEHYLIGEKVSYRDSIITFYLDNQILVEKTNLSVVKKKFEKIEKVEASKIPISK